MLATKTKLKVLVYPYTPDNPYQKQLYDTLEQNNFTTVKTILMPYSLAGFLFQIFSIVFILIYNRLHGYRLIHVHWLYQLGFPGRPIWPWLSQLITTIQIHIFLLSCKALGYRLVWTVHDIVPHHRLSLNDTAISRAVIKHAAKLILLSKSTLKKLDAHGLHYDKTKIAVIPHGSYIGSYKNTVSRIEARQKLTIDNKAFTYLFFGTVLPYKNVLGMLKAFEFIIQRHSKVVMIIAGRVAEAGLEEKLREAERRLDGKLRLHLSFIDDTDVQAYFNAADVVVFPYLQITNSGVALLAASFAKPVIAPRLGAFNDLPKNSGIFYTAGNQAELQTAMERTLVENHRLPAMSAASLTYARSLSWDKIGRQTYELYNLAIKS